MLIYSIRCPKCGAIIVLEELPEENILDMVESDYELEELTDSDDPDTEEEPDTAPPKDDN